MNKILSIGFIVFVLWILGNQVDINGSVSAQVMTQQKVLCRYPTLHSDKIVFESFYGKLIEKVVEHQG